MRITRVAYGLSHDVTLLAVSSESKVNRALDCYGVNLLFLLSLVRFSLPWFPIPVRPSLTMLVQSERK